MVRWCVTFEAEPWGAEAHSSKRRKEGVATTEQVLAHARDAAMHREEDPRRRCLDDEEDDAMPSMMLGEWED